MATGTVLYLSRNDVESIAFSMSEIILLLEEMFLEKGEGRVEMPPKPGIHTRQDAFIHAMPAYIPAMEVAGMKWVSGYPDNPQKKLPYITGLIILNDPETGIPKAVMDCTWITAMRTGAATAVAAKYLAQKDSSTTGIIGCGVQGRSNLEALTCLFDIQYVKAFDIDPSIAQTYVAEMTAKYGVEIAVVKTAEDAVKEMDIVITSGPILRDPCPTIEAGWLSPGAFACPLDFDSYWTGDAFNAADKIITDDHSQLEYYRKEGYFQSTPLPHADLGEIVAGKKPGREKPNERIISLNLGLALEDMVVASRIYQLALERNLGIELPL